MRPVTNAVTARITKGKKHFEVLVDCDKALDYKAGKMISLTDVLKTNDVYSTARSGKHAALEDLKKAFSTTDNKKIAEMIIRQGDIQITAEHRKRILDQQEKKLISILQEHGVNTKTNQPYSTLQLHKALQETKIKLNETQTVEQQLPNIIKKLSKKLTIKLETRTLLILIPALYAPQTFHALKSHGQLHKEEWSKNGDLIAELELPAGMQNDLEKTLEKITKGNTHIEIIQRT